MIHASQSGASPIEHPNLGGATVSVGRPNADVQEVADGCHLRRERDDAAAEGRCCYSSFIQRPGEFRHTFRWLGRRAAVPRAD